MRGGGNFGGDRPQTQYAQKDAKPRNSATIYVANLGSDVNEAALESVFTGKGFEVLSTKLLYDNFGKPKGAGFVEMSSLDVANDAVKTCQGITLGEKRLLVQIAKQ